MKQELITTAFNFFDKAQLHAELTDAIIKVHGEEFEAHKVIMCVCSPYFR